MRSRFRNAVKAASIGLALSLPLTSCHSEKKAESPTHTETQKMMGKHRWYDEYYKPVFNKKGDRELSPHEANAQDRAAVIDDEREAGLFYDYMHRAALNDLETPQAKELIARTTVKLEVLHRALVGRYFRALESLADECDNDKKGFEKRLRGTWAGVEAEARPFCTGAPYNAEKLKAAVNRADNLIQGLGNSC